MPYNRTPSEVKSDRYQITRNYDESDPVAVKLERVTKRYRLYKNDRQRFKMLFNKKFRRSLKTVTANDKISITIMRGETVNFIGANGAGKSTCLQIIAGTTFPTSGKVYTNGHISASVASNAGLDKNLTGRENLRFRAQVLGLGKDEIDKLLPDVIDFTELGDFIDQPIKTYSSGMKSRLGVSMAFALNPEILIVDESLSVGDRKFSKKCKQKINQLMADNSVTMLFVSHSPTQAREFCKRGIILQKGKVVFDGDIDEAEAKYESF
jgi:teichoic acid transport system ATP-binding protein